MPSIKTPIVVANWKMNPVTLVEAKTIITTVKKSLKKNNVTKIVIAPPTIYLGELAKLTNKSDISLAAQNMHYDVKGAYTGEHSGQQLSDAGVSSVIIGHSERRLMGESDELIAKKVLAAAKAKLVPIICVGETSRDNQGNFYIKVESQIRAALSLLPKTKVREVVIAYEPVWAIGTGLVPSNNEIQEMRLYIEKVLTKLFDRKIAGQVAVLYGGSVNADNAKAIFAETGVRGFLVGGASLKPKDFLQIITAVN